jgi:hypothetical protein
MKNNNLSLLIGVVAFLSCQKEQISVPGTSLASQSTDAVLSNPITLPISAVSFPKEIIPVEAGKIDFWGKLYGYSGNIPTSGDPVFYYLTDGVNGGYSISFASNDGLGDGGLIGNAGTVLTGTGPFGSWTYQNALNGAPVDTWHRYTIIWNKNGLSCFSDNRKVAVYVDGKLNSKSWHVNPNGEKFLPMIAGTVNLIHTSAPFNASRKVAIDEFKVYDKKGNLVLWNTLGSETEVENSQVGLNGSFNGYGNASFVPGISGNALIANPVKSDGNP